MEGMPARGAHRTRGVIGLSQARDLQTFQAELARLLESELQRAEVFVAPIEEASKELQLPSWLKSHLGRHPALGKKLQQGELVGIPHTEASATPRPASAARSSVLLVPVFHEAALLFVIGVISSMETPQPSQEDLETIREIGHDSAPLLARLYELESLRRENAEITAAGSRSEALEQAFAAVTERDAALEAIIKMRSHLQSNVAHELRTPLAAVRGYARMILDGRAGEINSTQREYLTVVAENTNRLIDLVKWMDHVLELSTQYLKLSTFDLRALWAECLQATETLPWVKSLQLKEHFSDESFVIMGDRDKLASVLNRLISAAAKFTGNKGHVVAEFARGRDKDVTIRISVAGAEIGAAELAPDVYDIVGMHGGRVFVNSKAGEGSTLLVTLPAVLSDGEEKLSHEQAIHPGRRRR